MVALLQGLVGVGKLCLVPKAVLCSAAACDEIDSDKGSIYTYIYIHIYIYIYVHFGVPS